MSDSQTVVYNRNLRAERATLIVGQIRELTIALRHLHEGAKEDRQRTEAHAFDCAAEALADVRSNLEQLHGVGGR